MSIPLVSAIMPVYNEEDAIKEAIDSICSQEFQNWELIIIDDGSTDSTSRIIHQINDERIRYYYQENKGRGAARNKGLLKARGDYIAITDADDISLQDRFSKEVRFLESHPEYYVVSGQVMHFNDREEPHSVVYYPTNENEIDKKFKKGTMAIAHPAAMVRKKAFEVTGMYSEECLRAQDLEFFLRINHHFKIGNLEDTLILYRDDPRTTSLRFWIRLHYYHEYAMYRYQCYKSDKLPSDFEEWKRAGAPHLKIYTYHLLRYIKTKVSSYIKWASV